MKKNITLLLFLLFFLANPKLSFARIVYCDDPWDTSCVDGSGVTSTLLPQDDPLVTSEQGCNMEISLTYCGQGNQGECPHCPNRGDANFYTGSDQCCGNPDLLTWSKYLMRCEEKKVPLGSQYSIVWVKAARTLSTGDKCVNPTDISMDARDCDGNPSGAYKYCCAADGSPEACIQVDRSSPYNDGILPEEGICPGGDGYTPDGVRIRTSPCPGSVQACTGTCYAPYSGQTLCSDFNNAQYTYNSASGNCTSPALCCTQTLATDTCPLNGGFCYTDPAASTCAGYTAAYPGYYYADVSGTCSNGGACCSRTTLTPCGRCSTSYDCKYAEWYNNGDCGIYNNPTGNVTYTTNCDCNYDASDSNCSGCPVNMFYCQTSDYTCQQTSNKYYTTSACQTFIWMNFSITTDCYTSSATCSSNCISPAPTTPAPTYTYSWNIGDWGDCLSCSQSRTVICVRNDGVTVNDSFCTLPKPATSQSCGLVSGSCGSSFGSCITGNVESIDSVGSDGTYNWNCLGICGGSTDICSSSSCTPLDGSCGTEAGACTAGVLVWVDDQGLDGTYNWNCLGVCGGNDFGCTAQANQLPTIDGLVIKNNLGNVVNPESGNRNQICQTDFNNSRLVTFEVTVSDPDGFSDISDVFLTWNGRSIPRISAIGPVTTFGEVFPQSVNSSGTYSLVATVIDNQGASGVDSSRQFKFWDCLVSVSGTAYDGTATGGFCSDSNSFSATIDGSIGFDLVMNDVTGYDEDKAMTVVSPNYSSGSNDLIWGRDYLFQLSNFTGSDPSQIRLNGSFCSNVQFSLNSSIVDPYSSSTSFIADFSSVLDKNPWWRAVDGGVFSNSQIKNKVPTTCVTNCDISVGGLVAAPSITNTGKNGVPVWSYIGRLANVNTNYSYFYNQYFVRNAIGNTNASLAQIKANPNGVYFVNGDLNINENIIKAASDFLMIIVNGDITVDAVATRVDGILAANNINTVGVNDNQLIFNGSLFAQNNISFTREYLTSSKNNTVPTTVINFDPRLLFNLPPSIARVLTNWQWGN